MSHFDEMKSYSKRDLERIVLEVGGCRGGKTLRVAGALTEWKALSKRRRLRSFKQRWFQLIKGYMV